jgi:EmrB/QacA subfamily drug resistance transporter
MSGSTVRPGVVLAVVCLSNFIASIDLTIINVALPTLSRVLKADNAEMQWIVDAYSLTAAGLLLSAGNIGDRYGRRGWLTIGLLVVAAASAVAANVGSAGAVIALRAAMGIGAAIILPTTLALVTNIFADSTQRARAIGIWSAFYGIGVIVGPIIGGWLLEHFALGSIFWINVPIAVVAIIGANIFVPTSRHNGRPPIDLPGLLLSAIGVTLMTYSIIEAPKVGWISAQTSAGFVIATILLVLFVRHERRTPHPMLDLSIFTNRRFAGGSIAVTVAYLALCGFVFVASQYLQFVTAYSALQTGIRLLPLAGSYAFASVLAPRFVERLGTTVVVTSGLGLFACAVASAAAFSAATPYWAIAAAMICLAGGLGLTMAPATESIMGSLSIGAAGVGSAVTGVTRQLGGCLGVAIVGSVFASAYTKSLESSEALTHIDHVTRAAMRQSMASAQDLISRAPLSQSPGIRHAVESAFLDAMALGCVTCAAFALAGAVTVAFVLPGGARSETSVGAPDTPDSLVTSPD